MALELKPDNIQRGKLCLPSVSKKRNMETQLVALRTIHGEDNADHDGYSADSDTIPEMGDARKKRI